MDAVNYSRFRDNMKEYCDRVCEHSSSYIITRSAEKGNVILLSVDRYNRLVNELEESRDLLRRQFRHRTLKDRIAECGGRISAVEFDWGEPVGREML